MKTLAIDTATPRGSVALVDSGEVLGEVRLRCETGHSRSLLPAVSFLLEQLQLEPQAVEGFAVTLGPGSFTGVRVGLSTVQGLGLAARRPCLGISALDVLAARVRGAAEQLVAWIDAHRAEVYGAVYDGAARALGPATAGPPHGLLADLAGPAAFFGDGALRYKAEILAARPDAVFPDRDLYLAGTLGRIAEPRLAGGEGVEPGALRPIYLRAAEVRSGRP